MTSVPTGSSPRYTYQGHSDGEQRVAQDLRTIVDAVRETATPDALAAVFLLGGYARGEGTVVRHPDGELRGFNDYDVFLVFDGEPRERGVYAELGARLAGELDIDFVDLGLATREEVESAEPTLFWYELGEAHRLLWGGSAPVKLPRFQVDDIAPEEPTRLLVNRGMALLWAGLRMWPRGPLAGPVVGDDPGLLRFSVIAAHKAILAAGDARLLQSLRYSHLQEERLATVKGKDPGFTESLARDYEAAAAFRRDPGGWEPGLAGPLWERARVHHLQAFLEVESRRLQGTFSEIDWPDYEKDLQRWQRRRDQRPREVLRRLRRQFLGGHTSSGDYPAFMSLVDLLYRRLPREGGSPEAERSWRTDAASALGAWHP